MLAQGLSQRKQDKRPVTKLLKSSQLFVTCKSLLFPFSAPRQGSNVAPGQMEHPAGRQSIGTQSTSRDGRRRDADPQPPVTYDVTGG